MARSMPSFNAGTAKARKLDPFFDPCCTRRKSHEKSAARTTLQRDTETCLLGGRGDETAPFGRIVRWPLHGIACGSAGPRRRPGGCRSQGVRQGKRPQGSKAHHPAELAL